MKNIYALALLVLSAVPTFAQDEYFELVSEDNFWQSWQSGFFVINAEQYFDGDSVIGDYTYYAFYSVLDIAPDSPALDGWLREDVDEQTIYVRSGGEDKLMYDFDVQPGDIFVVESQLCQAVMQVESLTTATVNGQEREQINFLGDDGEYWIEGIGSVYSVFHPGFIQCNLTDFQPEVKCFYTSGEWYWTNPAIEEPCEDITISVPSTEAPQPALYPNPVDREFKVVFTTPHSGSVDILTMSGEVAKTVHLADAFKHQIDVSDLPTGIYVVQITTENGEVFTSRLIKG
ncbi:MAG: T9SS type A sorting domain-containing protein [Flavobacteriales bacterium]|nr:T9SS type A sorting domain-containing protein [Flavobacteriales bacterium]